MRFGRHTQNNFALAWPCLGSIAFCIHLLRSFTDRDLGTGVDEKKERKRERAVSLGLRGKPRKPMHGTCTAHEGTGRPLKEVLKAWMRKWAWQASTLWQEWRQKEGCGGPTSLVEQGYFISRTACLYIFSKMITQPLQRMKFHQLQLNG